VHAVNVVSPPDTIATSWSFKSRAPWRSNTLFWLFILSPFVIAPVERAQSLQESWFGGAGNDAARNRLAALVEVSIDCAGRSHAAFGRRLEAAAYLLDFLSGQITSASANQYSVLIIHAFSPFIIGSVDGP
jgi:hypothetical protein